MTVTITSEGTIRFIYDDALAPLLALGESTVRRASHVEPTTGGWSADLSPVSGPLLGPFALRSAALAAEVEWLQSHGF